MKRRETVFALAALGAVPLASRVARSNDHRGDGLKDAGTGASQSGGIGATNQRTGVFYAGDNGPANALGAAQSEDVLLVKPGTYTFGKANVARSCTLRAENPASRPVLQMPTPPTNQYFLDVAADVSLTLEDIVLLGQKSGAGSTSPNQEMNAIYTQGGTYTMAVRRCRIADWGHGIMVGNHPNGTVLIEDSEFSDNGNYNGQTHHIYIGCKALTVRGCWFHNTKSRQYYGQLYGTAYNPGPNDWRTSWGHLIKTRARTTLIEGCRLTHETGEGNRCVDASNGGDVTIRGCLMEINNNNYQIVRDGGSFINYGVEEAPEENALRLMSHSFHFEQNTLVQHQVATADCQFLRIRTRYLVNGPPSPMVIKDNVFAGFIGALTAYIGGVPPEGAIYEPSGTDNTIISRANMTARMPGHATFDFQLATPVVGSRNWSRYAYLHPASRASRTDAYRGGTPPSRRTANQVMQ